MACILCTLWGQLPYAKRHTTPTTAQDTENALVLGYWAALHYNDLCNHHYLRLLKLKDSMTQVDMSKPAEPPAPPQVAQEGFKLGPGPLPNENNSITTQPALPMVEDMAAPYREHPPLPMPPTAKSIIEMAKEAALAEPTEGAKVTYACPQCGQQVSTGDVHIC